MYNVEYYEIPQGYKYNDFINELVIDIRAGVNVEENKDILFRITYPLAVKELKKYSAIDTYAEMLPDVSIAFMKTLKNYDPYKERASFMNYYKLAMRSEILLGRYQNRNTEDKRIRTLYDDSVASLDMKFGNKKGEDVGTVADVVPDSNADVTKDILYNDLVETIYRAMDKIKVGANDPEMFERDRAIFMRYLEACMNGEKLKKVEIAEEFGVSFTYARNRIEDYKGRLEAILQKEGWR